MIRRKRRTCSLWETERTTISSLHTGQRTYVSTSLPFSRLRWRSGRMLLHLGQWALGSSTLRRIDGQTGRFSVGFFFGPDFIKNLSSHGLCQTANMHIGDFTRLILTCHSHNATHPARRFERAVAAVSQTKPQTRPFSAAIIPRHKSPTTFLALLTSPTRPVREQPENGKPAQRLGQPRRALVGQSA